MSYIRLQEILNSLGLKKGDILLVSSNIITLLQTLKRNENISDLNCIIDILKNLIGDDGTLLFPTYNWNFCKGELFDYYNTPSMTGSLSKIALKRRDFKRTKHPIYSFAVWGKYQNLLCSLDNTDSFGPCSPFDFLYQQHCKNLIIDMKESIDKLKKNRFIVIQPPNRAIALNNKYVTFLFHKDIGIIELYEE
jgi:aminoglycoside 3-N-acetyltransferase